MSFAQDSFFKISKLLVYISIIFKCLLFHNEHISTLDLHLTNVTIGALNAYIKCMFFPHVESPLFEAYVLSIVVGSHFLYVRNRSCATKLLF